MAIQPVYSGNPRSADFPRREGPSDGRILEYMRSFEPVAFAHKVYDPITGKNTDIDLVAYTDGAWGWDESDIYLYEKYGLALDDGFIKTVGNGDA